ncbi:MAG TPA: magnesium/cobalt transporter CorA [Flavisolibacter sp.]|nr:magnesium/cobalt transporter CorA [Flavisolibacter sp.]
MVRRASAKLLRYLVPDALFGTQRTRQIVKASTSVSDTRKDADKVLITAYDYDTDNLEELVVKFTEECYRFKDNNRITWINVDGIHRSDVNKIGEHYGIHPLLLEDIVSMNQRPKMDEVEGVLYCLLNMLYFNDKENAVEQEQVSIVLGKDFVITFQEDPNRDVFDPIRDKLRISNSKLRQRQADYLCYSMLDLIVDNYFIVMEKLGERIELLEEEVIRNSNQLALAKITQLRKELIVLKRNLAPVRDLIGAIIRSENELLDDRTIKYFKDVHDHIIQAHDLSESYRDVMVSMQDLYINNVNLRMNEVMKVMAIVTCLLAPATVIGGIFGMNFDVIPTAHNQWGFYTAVGTMLVIPIIMLIAFKRRGWF